jgi:hypothetical protein
VPATLPTGYTYTVRISSVSNPLVYDESKDYFTIVNTILKGPYTQNFDGFTAKGEVVTGSWEQLLDDDLNWTVYTGPTPSRISATGGGTGPTADHTSGKGNYLYVEASGANTPAKTATILSPMVSTAGLSGVQIGFWYHMWSRDGNMGDLYVDVYANGAWSDSVVHFHGDQGDVWHEQVIQLAQVFPQLSAPIAKVQVRFRGVTGLAYDSDICIDDFRVTGTATRTVPAVAFTFVTHKIIGIGSRISYNNVSGQLSVIKLNGTKVMSSRVKGSGSLDMAKLPQGIYLVTVNGESMKFVR